MRFSKLLTVVLISSFSFSCLPLAQAQDQECDRSCLADFLDQYLNAIVDNDASKAPLSYGFRQTENAIVTPNDEGLWSTASNLGVLQRRYFDPAGSSAGFFGIIEENGEPAVVALRMKVSANMITEAEWHIGRESDVGLQGEPGTVYFDVDNLIANPPNGGFVPLARRYSRADLIAIANSYFDGIIAQNSKLIKGHPGCSRRENGFPTFGGALADGATGYNGTSDCRTSGDFGLAQVAARRVQVVDLEQQTAMLSVVFLRRPGNERWRNHFTEVFSIEDGLIRHVHAAMFYAKPTQPVPNWPPYDGNFPLTHDTGE